MKIGMICFVVTGYGIIDLCQLVQKTPSGKEVAQVIKQYIFGLIGGWGNQPFVKFVAKQASKPFCGGRINLIYINVI